MLRSPFSGFDEVRDKNFLLTMVETWIAAATGTEPHLWWVLNLDGDEELAPGAVDILRAVDPEKVAYSLGVDYLWNDPEHRRVDGVYGDFHRVSLFRPIPGKRFASEGWAQRGLHCGNAPRDLRPMAVRSEARILHYGYMHRDERVQKYKRYNEIDPQNENEDCYRHMIQGDGPPIVGDDERHEGERDISFPEDKAVLKHAGPLRLERIPPR